MGICMCLLYGITGHVLRKSHGQVQPAIFTPTTVMPPFSARQPSNFVLVFGEKFAFYLWQTFSSEKVAKGI